MHGGTLNLDSAPGIGTTARVRFPAWRLQPNDREVVQVVPPA
jgi:signal transduction histidine kinase